MKAIHDGRMSLGVCYYPEHWPESIWEDDLLRMKACGITAVRVGEFCWALFEPREGEFDFALFDRFLSLAQRRNMDVILGTPTATPPIWLTEKYPEVLNCKCDGTPYRHGLRRHYNYNSPVYRELCRRIVEKMGERYGHHPAVIGWQIDNELNCETAEFYSPADHDAFREWLRARHGTVQALSEAAGGAVWSQIYTDWSQVHLRRPTIMDQYNPHMLLEEKRFFSESAVSFCRMQCRALRPLIGEKFITTNGIFPHLDYTRLVGKDLDFLCYDSYPNFAQDMYRDPARDDGFRDRNWSRNLAEVRALSPAFSIMEQQSGANGWTGRMEAPMPRPGQMKLWTMQDAAHGADFVSYFRWRTAPFGTEIDWHGLNDYDNHENRRLAELREIRDAFSRLQDVAGSACRARIAYVRDYDNDWDAEIDGYHGKLHQASLWGMFHAAQRLHEPMDYLFLSEDTKIAALERYALLIYPHAAILEEGAANLLEEYVRRGGQVLLCAHTGYKDRMGRCPMRALGGRAAEMAGVRVDEYTFVGPYDEPGMADMGGQALPMPLFNDILDPASPDARVEATYTANYYAGRAALISRPQGRGRAWYYGATLSDESGMALLRRMGFGEPYGQVIELPWDVELAVREGDGEEFLFVLNYQRQPRRIRVRTPMEELLTGETLKGEAELPPFGAAVLRLEKQSMEK